MASVDRRKKLTIDEINQYWRRMKQGATKPELHKLTNAIRVLDLALAEAESRSSLCHRLSHRSWSTVRDDLFDILLSSFPGYFIVYSADSSAIEPGNNWPESGTLEFYPEQLRRRDDACQAQLSRVHSSLQLRLRWCFADGRQTTTPEDFASYKECMEELNNNEESEEARLLLEQLYQSCADEADKLKKIAHRKWWQLHYEARGCSDRRQKSQLRKEMEQLEVIWGRSS
ncbi:MAG TPA: hypothetical protein V6C81_25080 [Planktothrix sp.]|jgi:hypothetical protein